VGYGDVSPNSHTGKAITSIAIMVGVVFMAMPLQIVGSNFIHVWEDRQKTRVVVRIQERFVDPNPNPNPDPDPDPKPCPQP
jgi:hypothetical protein